MAPVQTQTKQSTEDTSQGGSGWQSYNPDESASETNEKAAESETDCPECSGSLSATSTETTCQDCGLVVDSHEVDHGAEWGIAAGSAEKTGHNMKRCNGGARDPSHHTHGLGSRVGNGFEHFGGMEAARKWNTRAYTGTGAERSRRVGFSNIKRVVSRMEFGRRVRNRASTIFREAQDAGLLVGDQLEGYIGAAVYAACRDLEIARLPDEVAELLAFDDEDVPGDKTVREKVLNCYGKVCRETDVSPVPIKPRDHVPRMASQLDVSGAVRREAESLAKAAENDTDLINRAPSSVAAGALYVASLRRGDSRLLQPEMASAVDVSERTIQITSNRLKELSPAKETAEDSNQETGEADEETGDTTDDEDSPADAAGPEADVETADDDSVATDQSTEPTTQVPSGATTLLEQFRESMDLDDVVIEHSLSLIEQVQAASEPVEDSPANTVAAAVYAACHERDVSCPPAALTTAVDATDAQADPVTEKALFEAYRTLCRETEVTLSPVQPRDHVPQLLAALDAPPRVRHDVEMVIEAAADAQVAINREAESVAAAAAYLASSRVGHDLSLADVVAEVDTSHRTVQQIAEMLADIAPPPTEEPITGQATLTVY